MTKRGTEVFGVLVLCPIWVPGTTWSLRENSLSSVLVNRALLHISVTLGHLHSIKHRQRQGEPMPEAESSEKGQQCVLRGAQGGEGTEDITHPILGRC